MSSHDWIKPGVEVYRCDYRGIIVEMGAVLTLMGDRVLVRSLDRSGVPVECSSSKLLPRAYAEGCVELAEALEASDVPHSERWPGQCKDNCQACTNDALLRHVRGEGGS